LSSSTSSPTERQQYHYALGPAECPASHSNRLGANPRTFFAFAFDACPRILTQSPTVLPRLSRPALLPRCRAAVCSPARLPPKRWRDNEGECVMTDRSGWVVAGVVAAWMLAGTCRAAPPEVKTLAIGAAAPDFALPGVDGRTHHLKDFARAKVLVVL